MGIAKETIEAVKNCPDVLALFQDYVSLKKKGKHYLGLCPFHSEKSPSFTVSPEKKMYYCFGCQASGDHISFVMQLDHLNFPEAIKAIAQRLNIQIIEDQNNSLEPKRKQYDEAVLKLLSDAAALFEKAIEKNPKAKEYFLKRGLSLETMRDFTLGYATETFIQQLIKQGNTKELLLKSGIVASYEGVLRSSFTGRLMIPVHNHLGKILGFGARVFEGDSKAKYINSSESPWYQKSKLLFGLHLAKKSIKQKGYVIVVEGYMDVMMMHQYGYQNTVASMGTAFVLHQVQLLKRFTDTVYLAFDQDEAGKQAVLKSYLQLKPAGFSVKVLNFSQKDLADLCQQGGQGAIDEVVSTAKPFLLSLMDTAGLDPEAPVETKSRQLKDLKTYIDLEEDVLIKDHYLKELAQRLNISEKLVGSRGVSIKYTNHYNAPSYQKKDKYQKAEALILVAAVSSITFRDKLKQLDVSFYIKSTIYMQIQKILTQSELFDQAFLESIGDPTLKAELARLVLEDEEKRTKGISEDEWNDCMAVLEERSRQEKVKVLQQKLKQKNVSDEQLELWLNELKELLNQGY